MCIPHGPIHELHGRRGKLRDRIFPFGSDFDGQGSGSGLQLGDVTPRQQGVERQHGPGALTGVDDADAADFQPAGVVTRVEAQAFQRFGRQGETKVLKPLMGLVILAFTLGLILTAAGVT